MRADPHVQLALALCGALALDALLKRPWVRWHPVAGMVRYLGWIGGLVAPRSALPSPNWTSFWAGALAWYGGAMAVVLLAWVTQSLLLQALPWPVAALALGLLLETMLSWRMPRDEAARVEPALALSLDAGRRQLGRVADREVMQLDAAQVREAAIESLAKSFLDGLVGPVLWFVLAGLPGAVLYRFASMADTLWGHRGARAGAHWEWSGKWAARVDDVLGWLPARLAALLLAAVGGGLSLAALRAEARRTASPNNGWPMAALALLLGVTLRRRGALALNAAASPAAAGAIPRAVRLCNHAAWLLLAWALATLALLHWGRSA